MNKTVFILFAAALAFVGCNKSVEEGAGETVSASFQISTEMTTKATLDGDGKGVNVNRFIMEVWHVTGSNAEIYTRQVKSGNDVTAGNDISNPAKTTFTVALVKGQTYDLLFWADCGNADGSDLYYKTDVNLKAVAMMDTYKGNDDRRDAFSKCVTLTNVTSDPSMSVQLERPFAQLNIITQDIDDIEDNTGTARLVPDKISVAFEAPTVFNVKTQDATASAPFTSNVAPYYSAVGSQTEHYTLSMDYILASKNQQDIQEVTLTAKKNDSVLNTQTFSNIPLQRNYRTNIKGNLLTTTGVFTVETAPAWDSPENNILLP